MRITYRPEIDGLRAVAVAAVIIYHAKISIFGHNILEGGYIGVDIFLVISGYLITSIILKELVTTGNFSFKNFYERRARRILPALLFVMLASLPLAWIYLLPNDFMDFAKSLLYSLGFSSNFYFYFSSIQYEAESGLLIPFLHTWSLSVEEQYYILFPVALIATFKYFKKYIFAVLVTGLILSLFFAHWGSQNHPSSTFYLLHTRMWELIAGSLLAYFEIKLGNRSNNKTLNQTLPILGLFLIFYSFFFFNEKTLHPSFLTCIPIIGICLIIWFTQKEQYLTKLLSTKLFVGVGLISYSLYLWHYPIFSFYRYTSFFLYTELYVKIIIAVLIFCLSIITYFLIEKPFRDKSKIILPSLIKYLIFTNIIIFILCISVVSNNGFSNRYIKLIKNIYEKPKYVIENKKHKKTVYLIGDSQILPIIESLQANLQKINYGLVVYETMFFENHDIINVETLNIKENSNIKNLNNNKKINQLINNEDNNIFIFMGRYPLYLSGEYFHNQEGAYEEYGGGILADFYKGSQIDDINNKLKLKQTLKRQINTSFEKILKNNYLILVYPVPEVGFHVPKEIFKKYTYNKNDFLKKLNKDKYILTTSYEVYLERNKEVFELFDGIQNKNLYRFYPHKIFCNDKLKNRCITHDNDNVYYKDYNHLSYYGASIFVENIIQEILLELLENK